MLTNEIQRLNDLLEYEKNKYELQCETLKASLQRKLKNEIYNELEGIKDIIKHPDLADNIYTMITRRIRNIDEIVINILEG